MPPTWLLLATLIMILLRIVAPVTVLLHLPWTAAGVIPIAAGAALNLVADRQFKKLATTVKPFEASSEMVTDGAYRISRHPMYLGMVAIVIGIGIVLGAASPLVVPVLFALLMEIAFIQPEERMMNDQFGEAYRDYRHRVRRWL
jgi:protein-S-isoprenylcysteine O-methyltransferase Ste14